MRRLPLLAAALAVSLLFIHGCKKDSTAPDTWHAKIAILDDDSTGTMLGAILTTAGHDVTNLGSYYDYAGADLGGYDLVFMLSGYEYGWDLADSVQQALLDYVSGGGTLVTTEWITYSGNLDLLDPALPLAYDGGYCDTGGGDCIDTLTVDVRNTITEGLPATFATPPDYTYSYCKVNAASTSSGIQVLLTGQDSGPALAVGAYGSGHILHWNMAGAYEGPDIWDANTSRILTNLALYSR